MLDSFSHNTLNEKGVGVQLQKMLKVNKIMLFFVVIFGVFVQFSYGYYSSEWIVRLNGIDPKLAEEFAVEMGYKYVGEVYGFKNTYIFIQNFHPLHQKRAYPNLTKQLNSNNRVIWAEQLLFKPRQKRDEFFSGKLNRAFNDELWPQEWYLQDTRTKINLPKLDLNVLSVYKAGITGRGVRVTILDDGLEYTHDDIRDNYDPEISWNCKENNGNPTPTYNAKRHNSHGTRCAGEVAMSANNRKCGVGIAFNANIGGVKMLDGLVNDHIEGTALGFAHNLVDIYSASWGPNDDGKTVDGPGRLAKEAFERGVTQGRDGKGAIYVWASGNGGQKGDNCNCDGYLASIYTISIGSASQRGEFPWYGEECSSTMAVTYSSGAYRDQMIVTTDLNNQCTVKHTGTSAAAPLAAGIIALALEANPNLTWRDVQHLIAWTCEYAPISDNDGWQMNAGGFLFNTRFGFGLMNAFTLVSTAANWTTVPPKMECTINAEPLTNNMISSEKPITIYFDSSLCEINYLEHVQIKANIEYSVRGDLEIYLKSAADTSVQILGARKLDKSPDGFVDWTFMSVMTWGENPKGTWSAEIRDSNGVNNSGFVNDIFLTLHGTEEAPAHMKNGPRMYNHNYNRIHKNIPNYAYTNYI